MTRPGGGAGLPAPPEPDVFSELRRISKELRALTRTVQAATRTGGSYQGSDSSGAITITVDGHQHVQEVIVDPRWSQRLDRDRLGDALMEAYGQAVCQLLTAASAAFDEAERDVDEADLTREVEQELQPRHRRHVPPDELLEEVQEQLRKIDIMRRLGDGTVAGPAGEPSTVSVRGSDGFIEMTVSGGQLSAIRVHLSRMPAGITNGMLAREALSAFRAAAEAARRGGDAAWVRRNVDV